MNTLRSRVVEAIEESRVKAGHENFYRTQAMREVLGWIDELRVDTPLAAKKTDHTERPDRVVHGVGEDDRGQYEVVRYAKSKQYWVEHVDVAARRQITLSEGIGLTQTPILDQEGGTAFDRAWRTHIDTQE